MRLEERVFVQKVEDQASLSPQYIEYLLDTLPTIKPHNPKTPEWRATPHRRVDLSQYGVDAVITVKDESDRRSNHNGTHKSRKSWELGPVTFRAMAENFHRRGFNGSLHKMPIPRLCEIGSGNSASAQAIMNERYGLPAPTLIVGTDVNEATLNHLTSFRLNVVQVPLNYNIFTGEGEMPYTASQIREIADLPQGHDLTSSAFFHRDSDFYDWHIHEAFNAFEKSGEIYVPAGSEELFSHYVNWQHITARNGVRDKDPRLQTQPEIVTQLHILGAEPEERYETCADKLRGIKPFKPWNGNDVDAAKLFGFTGSKTDIYSVGENYITYAHSILQGEGIEAEHSGAAALGLFLQRYERGEIEKGKPILVVNTGKGV